MWGRPAATWTSGHVVERERRAGEARARRCLVVVVLVYLAVDAAMMECAVHERVHEIVHDVEGGDRRERVQRGQLRATARTRARQR